MADVRLLIDSDIFVLLSGAGLLDRALTLLGFDRNTACRLSPLPHIIRSGKKFRQLRDPQARQRALDACASVWGITDRPSDELLQAIIAFPEIDEGEALLYALLAGQPAYLLTSADKRAMQTLGARPELSEVRQRVAGRVICLETVLDLLVRHDGAEATAHAFAVFPEQKTFQVVFSPLNIADQEKCLGSLASYLRDLKRQVGDDFLYEP